MVSALKTLKWFMVILFIFFRRDAIFKDYFVCPYVNHTWKKVGILATGCLHQGPKNDANTPKLAKNQRKKTKQKSAPKF